MEFAELIKTPKVDGVVLKELGHRAVEGTLCVTGHHLIFSSRKSESEELWLLHRNVDAVERRATAPTGQLVLKCKDFRIVELELPLDEAADVANSVEALCALTDVTLYYPFFCRHNFNIFEDGWQAFLPEQEFGRLAGEDWRISHVNKNFEVCPSYPKAVVVPKSIDDDMLAKSAAFRQGGRFPVLSYRHTNGMVIMRSSQPLTGPSDRRCREDERLLNACLIQGSRGYIVDTRSIDASQLAKSRGGGFESESSYPQWRRLNRSLDGPAAIYESFCKLGEACTDPESGMDKWLGRLGSSGWLSQVKDCLTVACLTAQCLDREKVSVLVHGAEGVDTTLLVTSLAQVILDPDCRTIRGLEALVEREWLQAGHPIQDRCSSSVYAARRSPRASPIFPLFLDCVSQVHRQFPCSFEFTEQLLVFLARQAYASKFGTFLGNSCAERHRHQLSSRTTSLWSYLNNPEVLETFINPLFQPNGAVVWPSVAPQSLVLWSSLYLSWEGSQAAHRAANQEIAAIKQKDKEVKLKAQNLKKEYLELVSEMKTK